MKETQILSKRQNPLINRNFTLLWSGQIISQIGDYAFDTTLVLWIATIIAQGQSWGPIAVSGIFLAASIPRFLVQPFAGVYVDRWNKRKTMIRMDMMRALLILFLILLTSVSLLTSGTHFPLLAQLGFIYLIVFLASICAQFFNPSSYSIINEIVPEVDRTKAFGLNHIVQSLATVIGPSVAGLLVFGLGIRWALLLNALSFVISFLSVSAIQLATKINKQEVQKSSFFQEFREGLHFFMENSVLKTLTISVILNMLGFGLLTTLDVYFFIQNLHASANLYGFLGASFGIGSIIGASLANQLTSRLSLLRTYCLTTIAMGIVVIIFARQTNAVVALFTFALFGILNALGIVAAEPITMHVTPPELLGRVSSVVITSWSVALIFSTAIAGYLDASLNHFHTTFLGFTFGPVDTLFTGAGILLIISGFYSTINFWNTSLTAKPLQDFTKKSEEMLKTNN